MLRKVYWYLCSSIRLIYDAFSPASLHDVLVRMAARRRLLRTAALSGASVGLNVEVIGLERLTLGKGTVVQSNVTLHCGGMDWTNGGGEVRFGQNCFVGHGVVLYGGGGITIGDDVLVSPCVVITSHEHSYDAQGESMRTQPTRFRPVSIDPNVWIGSGAIILPGVHLGAGCIVGAGAVVSRSVEPGALVLGIPARQAKMLPAVKYL